MSKLSELKNYLKVQAVEIRTLKAKLKEYQKKHCGYDNGMFYAIKKMAENYRNHHIAYCLIRGKSYEQIEKNVAANNKPNMELIQGIKNAYKEDVCLSA